MAESSKGAQCASAICDGVGLLITVLQVGQFVPQHVEMVADRSTAGLSPWLLFFGSLYTYLAFLDIALTDTSSVFTCGANAYRCFIGAQPYIQMLLSAVLSSGLWYWFLRFHKPPVSEDEAHLSTPGVVHALYDAVSPQAFFQLNAFLIGLTTVIGIYVVHTGNTEQVIAFAHGCGNLAAVLNAVMWLPQIVVTAAFGHKGALSLYWVIASVVMDVAYSVYLAFMGLDMSVWLNNVPDGIQTSILLCIILYYNHRDRDLGTDQFGRRLSVFDKQRFEEQVHLNAADRDARDYNAMDTVDDAV